MTTHVSAFVYLKLGLFLALFGGFCVGMLAYQYNALPLLVGVL